MFIVAGASGNVGLSAVQKLVESGAKVKALTRSSTSDKVAPLNECAQVQVVQCDLLDKASLANVFDGAKGAFLISANCKDQVEAEKNFIDCAVASGCPYLVKLGTIRSYTAKDSQVTYARFHAEVEEHLQTTAGTMKWTVLSPNCFMSNHLGDIFGTLPTNKIVYPVDPDAKAAIIDPRDVGDIAAQLLLASDPSAHHGLKLDISGPEQVSLSQIAALYTEVLCRPIHMVKCPVSDWIAAAIASGFEDWMAEAVSHNFTKWEDGTLCFPTSPEALALAAPHRTMAQWVKEWAPRSPPPASA